MDSFADICRVAAHFDCQANFANHIATIRTNDTAADDAAGFGGQSFIPHTLEKIRQVRAMLDRYEAQSGRHIAIEVDGGIKTDNIAAVAAAGADTFVAGSAIFGKPDYKAVIDAMRKELASVA